MKKIKWNETTIRAFSSACVLCIAIAFYFLMMNLGNIFSGLRAFLRILTPFIYGFGIAYLLYGPMSFFEKHLKRILCRKKERARLLRTVSIILTVLCLILILISLFAVLIPQLASSIETFINNIPSYLVSLQDFTTMISTTLNLDISFIDDVAKQFSVILQNMAPHVLTSTIAFTSQIANFIFGMVISVYVLAKKRLFAAQFKKIMYALLPKDAVNHTLNLAGSSHKIFRRYISGQLLDAFIVGTITFISLTLLGMPFPELIGVIIGVTNIIPILGPFIGAIPSTFIIFMASDFNTALLFCIFILLLQQVDGNVIAPKIVGNFTGLSGFWVMFAVLVGGGLFGIFGIILGVPAFSIIYTTLKLFFEKLLTKKGMSPDTKKYEATRYEDPPKTE